MFRNLKFTNLDEVLSELEKIENAKKFTTVGVWSYYQILKHVSELMEYSMTSYPIEVPKLVQYMGGGLAKEIIFFFGTMLRNIPNPLADKKRIEGDHDKELKLFRERIVRLKNFSGEFARHPIFGELKKEEWIRLHSIHSAHHLSFVNY